MAGGGSAASGSRGRWWHIIIALLYHYYSSNSFQVAACVQQKTPPHGGSVYFFPCGQPPPPTVQFVLCGVNTQRPPCNNGRSFVMLLLRPLCRRPFESLPPAPASLQAPAQEAAALCCSNPKA